MSEIMKRIALLIKESKLNLKIESFDSAQIEKFNSRYGRMLDEIVTCLELLSQYPPDGKFGINPAHHLMKVISFAAKHSSSSEFFIEYLSLTFGIHSILLSIYRELLQKIETVNSINIFFNAALHTEPSFRFSIPEIYALFLQAGYDLQKGKYNEFPWNIIRNEINNRDRFSNPGMIR